MANNKKIVELNQTSTRIVEVLDATDNALKVKDDLNNPIEENVGKLWTTSFNEIVGDDGNTTRVSKVETKNLSDLQEYISLNETTNTLNEKINDDNTGLEAQNVKIGNLIAQVEELYNRIGDPQSTVTITPVTPLIYSVQLKNTKDLVVKYRFLSTSGGESNGAPGKVTWTVNDQLVKTEQISQNIPTGNEEVDKNNYNTFDFSSYAKKGVNVIRADFEDSYGTIVPKIWTITTVDFKLEIRDFEEEQIYSGNVEVNYYIEGLNEGTSATVFFYLDNNENPIAAIPYYAGDTTKGYILPKQSHGAHLLQVYASQDIGSSQIVTSDKLYLDIMFEEEGNNAPIISWPYNSSDLILEQYKTQDFKYFVYTPNNPISEIYLISKLTYIDANDNQEKTIEEEKLVTSNWEDLKERQMQWKYTPAPQMAANTTATAELTIKSGETFKTKIFQVNKNAVNINPVTAGLGLDFNPKGRSNKDINYKEFRYESVNYTTTMTTSENFDWVNGGWQVDENGHEVFIIKTGSRMYLDYPLFYSEEGDSTKTSGKHFKFTYKATNCASFNAQVMSCMENLGRRYVILENTYSLDENEELKEDSIERYFLNGYNAADNTDPLLWENGEIGSQLISTGFEIDERDEEGVGKLTIVSIEESSVGVNFGSQEATLSSSFTDLPLVYCEDEILSVSMDIEPNEDRKSLMTAYINMDPSRVVKYASSTSFVQKNKQLIEFGSDECDVYIYRFKAYERNFSTEKKNGKTNEIFDDYLADTLDVDNILQIYERNNLLNSNGDLSIDLLKKQCPDLRIILITCPRFTNDKKDKVKGCTVEHIFPNGRPVDNWISKNVQIKGQGTSSNAYGTSARNIDLKFNPYTIEGLYKLDEDGSPIQVKDENGTPKVDDNGKPVYELLDVAFEYSDGTTGTKYSMTDESIGVNYINIKVNVASSENANNACLAEWYNRYDPYVRDVKKDGVRDTMEFHPCIIFIKEENTANWQEFEPDGQFHFYACGDFGNSKKNHKVFGMDESNLKECVVEISNNTHPITMFKTPEGWDDILPLGFDNVSNQLTEYADYWDGDAIEFRYPEDLFAAAVNKDNEWSEEEINDARARLAILQPQVQTLWRWIQSTDTTTATNIGLIPSVTYNELDENNNIIYYDTDSVEYRKAKFLHEYKNYFVEDSLLFQYLFTDRYLMIDNRAKNMFLHTVDGQHWDFTMDYDNDTSLGCENSGYLTLDYNLEDIDSINGIPVYNGNDSVLWFNVRTLLKNELEKVYNYDACKEAWSAKNLLEYMSKYQQVKPELLQMMDMQRKYIRPYKTGHGQSSVSEPQYLERLNGRKTYQRQRFETYREIFTGSKYRAASFESSAQDITIRLNNNPGFIEITPYCDMYPYVKWGNERDYPVGDLRVKAGQKAFIDISRHGSGATTNQEFHFCGATMLSDLGNLAGLKISEGNFSKGTKIKNLYIGDRTGTVTSNVAMTNVTLPDSPLLEEFDISYTKYEGALNFEKQVMLKRVYTERSNVQSITFATNGFLEEARLNALSELTMDSLLKLTENNFSMVYDVLTQITIKNTPALTESLSFLKSIGKTVSGTIEGLDIRIEQEDINLLDKFINEHNKSNLSLSGYADYARIYESRKNLYENIWGNLIITADEIVPTYEAIYLDWDGSELYVTSVTLGNLPIDPVAEGLIKTPIRASTNSTKYTFSGWEGDFTSPMIGPRTFIAKYDEEPMTYVVRWWIDRVGGTKLKEQVYNYGDEGVYIDSENKLAPQYDSVFSSYKLFKGWDKSTGYIKEDLDVIAQWESGYAEGNNYPEEKREWTAAQLYTVAQKNTILDFFAEEDGSPNGDRIQIQLGRSFNYTNLTSKKLINEPMKFDGTNYFDTEYKLFEEDKDWTLLIDAQFVESTNYEAVLASCYLENSGFGLKLKNGKYSKAHCIEWCGSSTTQASFVTREVFVIRHKQNSNYIDLFEGKCDELEPSKIQLYNATIRKPNVSLTLGAQKNSNGRYTNYAKGIVHRCEIWEGLLGDSDCKDLVNWPYEKMEFDVVDFGGYSYGFDGDNPTRIDLFASQLTWTRIPAYKGTNVEYGFHTSYIKQWLNERFFKALPVDWQAIIKSPYVTANSLNISTNEKTQKIEQTKLWIPAKSELSDDDWVVGDEFGVGSYKKIYTTDYNRRITRGISTVDVYSEDADWVYRQSTDPSLTKTIKNGSIWINSNTLQIYYNGFWFNWGNEYTIRSIGDSQSSLVQYFIQSGMTVGGSRTYTGSIMPCFSI